MVTFTVLGPPATKGSTVSWVGDGGQIRTRTDSTGLPAWTQAVGWAARAAGVRRVDRPCGVYLRAEFEFTRPKKARLRLAPTVKPDADKVARALLDALTDVAYEDDAQVVELLIIKRYANEVRTVVTVGAV